MSTLHGGWAALFVLSPYHNTPLLQHGLDGAWRSLIHTGALERQLVPHVGSLWRSRTERRVIT